MFGDSQARSAVIIPSGCSNNMRDPVKLGGAIINNQSPSIFVAAAYRLL